APRPALDGAAAPVDATPEPLLETAQTNPAPVEAAFHAVRQVGVRLSTDLTGALGGTLTFGPFAGDCRVLGSRRGPLAAGPRPRADLAGPAVFRVLFGTVMV